MVVACVAEPKLMMPWGVTLYIPCRYLLRHLHLKPRAVPETIISPQAELLPSSVRHTLPQTYITKYEYTETSFSFLVTTLISDLQNKLRNRGTKYANDLDQLREII
jgi:hypothetical protein